MSVNSTFRFSKKLLPAALGLAIALTSAGCMGPQFAPATSDAGWDTSYNDALSPHTQLALGVMNTLKDDPAQVKNQAEAAALWDKLAGQVEAKAGDADINATRAKIEALMGTAMVDKIKAEQYRKTDLMGFMISSGMKIPKGGSGSLNPDFMAAQQAAKMLKDGGASLQAKKASEYKAVSPEEALSPVESLTLGTAVLLAEDRDSFEMSQVFRLALYFRPLRRMYDPNPDLVKDLVKTSGANFETVYMDRIWRVLRPEQIAAIREMNLTRTDMDKYLKEHVQLYKVDPQKAPTFALLEYAVNDFHEQIAPPDTIPPEKKGDFFIPASVKRISGTAPGDGKKLFEGICASCHGVDGQGRFPPITMKSYLSLHSDHEHFEIVRFGPPQKPGSPIVMPTFGDKLTEQQMWAIVKYLRTYENHDGMRRGENEAREKGVKFYDTPEVYAAWQAKDGNRVFLDLQSDIAYRIMGHIPDSVHIRPEELTQKMGQLPKDKEIVVIDMFGSQGLASAKMLAEAGYRTSYMGPGMMDWHITRNYPVSYD